MKTASIPLTQDLVLVGGGHTHALALRKWGMNPLPGVRVTLINPEPSAPYSGMLPGFVAGHFSRSDLDIDLVKLARFAGARLVLGAADGIDLKNRTISVPGRPAIAFDVVSIDIGITSDMPDLPGFTEHATPAKPLGPFAAKWASIRNHIIDPKIAVLGGGVAGAELSMAMSHALQGTQSKPLVTLIDRGDILKELPEAPRDRLVVAIKSAGIDILEGTELESIQAKSVHFSNGSVKNFDLIVGAAGARAYPWLSQIGLKTHHGYITVGATLQSSDPNVFAVGDCAHMAQAPRPKAGVFAVRQAPILYENLRALLSGQTLQAFKPQRDYLKLISLGQKSALAEKLGKAVQGRLLWRWKNHIDQKFMDQFRNLPSMSTPAIPRTAALDVAETMGDGPMCAGCGAKVGRTALMEPVAALPKFRDDVLRGAGDDAAVLRTGDQLQVFTTDHLRAVTEDPVLMTRIAAHHALGDIWSMGAHPQAVTMQIILPRMSAKLQSRTLREITNVAGDLFARAGAEIVGGHTSMGEEFTIGFSITGLCDATPITLAGARVGDKLILTKPIGSGTILAADMIGQTQGSDVASCWDWMVQDQRQASGFLTDAHAMTDVTGFGLAGHLEGMCHASVLGAEVDLNAVPIMNGALELAASGVKSSLFGDNAALLPELTGGAKANLLFDPQTSGGLLAAIDPNQAKLCLSQLKGAGYSAVIIGQMINGEGVRLI